MPFTARTRLIRGDEAGEDEMEEEAEPTQSDAGLPRRGDEGGSRGRLVGGGWLVVQAVGPLERKAACGVDRAVTGFLEGAVQ